MHECFSLSSFPDEGSCKLPKRIVHFGQCERKSCQTAIYSNANLSAWHYFSTGYRCLPAGDGLHPIFSTWVPLGNVQDHGDVLVRWYIFHSNHYQVYLIKLMHREMFLFIFSVLAILQDFWSPPTTIIWGHWRTTEEGGPWSSESSRDHSNLRWSMLCLTGWVTALVPRPLLLKGIFIWLFHKHNLLHSPLFLH